MKAADFAQYYQLFTVEDYNENGYDGLKFTFPGRDDIHPLIRNSVIRENNLTVEEVAKTVLDSVINAPIEGQSVKDTLSDFNPKLVQLCLCADDAYQGAASRPFGDTTMKIYFRYWVSDNASAIVSDEVLKTWNLSFDDLYEMCLLKMRDQAAVIYPFGEKMPILSNNWTERYGAAVIVDTKNLDMAAEKIGYDQFYIIPSSVHEVILIPDIEDVNPIELRGMIISVNADKELITDKMFLSNDLYYYDAVTHTFKEV